MAETENPSASWWPDEIWLQVFSLCGWAERRACASVSRRLCSLARSAAAGRLPLVLSHHYVTNPALWPRLTSSIHAWAEVPTGLTVPWACSQLQDIDEKIADLIDRAPILGNLVIGERGAEDWLNELPLDEESEDDLFQTFQLQPIRWLLDRIGKKLLSLEMYAEGAIEDYADALLDFSTCTAITRLVVKAKNVEWPITIEGLNNCTSLVSLSIEGQHERVWPRRLTHLETVELMKLEMTEEDYDRGLDAHSFKPLATCHNITRLTLCSTNDPIKCGALKEMPNLVFLMLAAPILFHLQLRHNPALTRVILWTHMEDPHVLKGCTQIRQLQLFSHPAVPFADMFKDCTSLVDLGLIAGCDRSLAFIPAIAPHLQRLLLCDWEPPRWYPAPPGNVPISSNPHQDVTNILWFHDPIMGFLGPITTDPLFRLPELTNVTLGDKGEYTKPFVYDFETTDVFKSVYHYRICNQNKDTPHESMFCIHGVNDALGYENTTIPLPPPPILPTDFLVRVSLLDSFISDVSALSGCKRLREIDIEGCKYVDSLVALTKCPELRRISVGGCGVSDFRFIEKCTNLREIEISRPNMYPEVILGNQWPVSVKTVRFIRCPGVRRLTPLSHCTFLESLWVFECPDLRDLDPIRSLHYLHELRLEGESSDRPSSIGDWSAAKDHPSLQTVIIESVAVGTQSNQGKQTTFNIKSFKQRMQGRRCPSDRTKKRWPKVQWTRSKIVYFY